MAGLICVETKLVSYNIDGSADSTDFFPSNVTSQTLL